MALPSYFEAHTRTVDKATGVDTRLFVVKAPFDMGTGEIPDPSIPLYLRIDHNIKKAGAPMVPDWVRVTSLSREVPRMSPVPNNGVCQPVCDKDAMDPAVPPPDFVKHLVWADTVDGGMTHIHTDESLYFMVAPSSKLEGPPLPEPVYFDTYWLVEIGYTHSTPQ